MKPPQDRGAAANTFPLLHISWGTLPSFAASSSNAAPGCCWDQRTSPASLPPEEQPSWNCEGNRQRRQRRRHRRWAVRWAVRWGPFAMAVLVFVPLLLAPGGATDSTAASSPSPSSPRQLPRRSYHTSNHAVIVSSSRYWFNYRHAVNALSIYHILRDNGIPDNNIVLMVADEYAVNARNPLPNQLLATGIKGRNLFDNVTIDYRGDDVRVEQLVQVLEGKSDALGGTSSESAPPVLRTNAQSNILIYLTGHGGDQFFKFQDSEEILATQLASVVQRLHDSNKYHRILLMADTCQAYTLGDKITAPRTTILGSSLKSESSYAHHTDDQLGLSVIERYTHSLLQFLQVQNNTLGPTYLHQLTLQQGLIDPHPYESQRAHVGFRTTDDENYLDGLSKDLEDDEALDSRHHLFLSDFFAQAVVEEQQPGNTPPPPSQRTTRLLFPAVVGTAHTATPVPFRWKAATASHGGREGECRSEDPRTSFPRHALPPLPSPRWWRPPPWTLEPTDGAFVGLLVGFVTLTLVWIRAPVGASS